MKLDEADQELGAEWEQAAQAAAQQLSRPVAEIQQQQQTLLLLLPDLEVHFRTRKACAAAWEGVLAQVQQLQPEQLDRQELELMARVMAAIRVGPRDAETTMAHNRLVSTINNMFSNARYEGRLAGPEKAPVLRLLQQLSAGEQGKVVEQMVQQLCIAASTAGYTDKLIALRLALPEANISALITQHPQLVRMEAPRLQAACNQAMARLQPALEPADASGVLEAAPYLLEGELLQQVLEEMAKTFPEQEPAYMLQQHVKVGASMALAPYHQAARQIAADEQQAQGQSKAEP